MTMVVQGGGSRKDGTGWEGPWEEMGCWSWMWEQPCMLAWCVLVEAVCDGGMEGP